MAGNQLVGADYVPIGDSLCEGFCGSKFFHWAVRTVPWNDHFDQESRARVRHGIAKAHQRLRHVPENGSRKDAKTQRKELRRTSDSDF